jgi:hypothetical protein
VPSNIVDERRKEHTQKVPKLTGFLAKFARNVGDIHTGYHAYLLGKGNAKI